MSEIVRTPRRRKIEVDVAEPESEQDTPEVGPETEIPSDLAHPLRRAYAFLVDAGILMMVIFLVAPLAGGRVFSAEAAVVDVFIFLGYFIIPTGIFGRTPGKWVAGITVVDDQGEKPGVAVAIPREMVGRFVSIVALGGGLVWVWFDPDRQGWHDKIAGTYVINTPRTGGPGLLSRFFFPDENKDGANSGGRQSPARRRIGRPLQRQKRRRRGKR